MQRFGTYLSGIKDTLNVKKQKRGDTPHAKTPDDSGKCTKKEEGREEDTKTEGTMENWSCETQNKTNQKKEDDEMRWK